MKKIIAFLIVALIVSCDTPNEPEGINIDKDAHIAYAPYQGPMHVFDLQTGGSSKITVHDVKHISQSSYPGIILFEYWDDFANKLYGRCQDGSLIPVPKPHENDTTGFKTISSPGININYEGHYGFYFIYDEMTKQYLFIRVSCGNMKVDAFPLREFVKKEYGNHGEADAKPIGDYLLPNAKGDVYMALEHGKKGERMKFQIVKFTADKFEAVSEAFDDFIKILAYSEKTGVIFEREGEFYSIKDKGKEIKLPDNLQIKTPYQANPDGEIVAYNEALKAIEVYKADFTRKKIIIDNDYIQDKMGRNLILSAENLSISENGRYIMFTITEVPYAFPGGAYNYLYDIEREKLTKYSEGYLGIPPVYFKIKQAVQ